jgi:anti-sigma factor ChrR (cupin superfamily)
MKTLIQAAVVVTATALVACAAAQTTPVKETALAIKAQDTSLQWGPCPPIFPGDCSIAVLHGDPSKPNADVFLKVGGGYVIPSHTHSSAERMILVTGQLEVDYVGTPPATITTGQYAYGPARLPHAARCLSAEPCTLFIAFEGPVDAEAFSGPLD